MPPAQRKRKHITFSVDGVSYEVQVTSCQIVNNTGDGDEIWTYGPDGDNLIRDEADPSYALQITYLSDWSATGISNVLDDLDGQTVAFSFTDWPDVPEWTVTKSGMVKIKAPNFGGEVRTTDTKEVTFQVIGDVAKSRP